MKRRIIGGAIGLAAALIIDFLALMSTGGGHGSLMWVFIALIPNLAGLYFILMTALAASINSSALRWIFGIALSVNWIIQLWLLVTGVFSDEYTIKFVRVDPWSAVIITAIMLVPNLCYTGKFFVSTTLKE